MPTGRNHRRTMKVFYEKYGPGPWFCGECTNWVYEISRQDGNVHHKDGNTMNDAPDNLEVLHASCHISSKHPITEEMKIRISNKLKGRPSPTKGMTWNAEQRARMANHGEANGFYGKHHDDATLVRMRQPRKRMKCEDCGFDFAINWINRHKTEGNCV